MFVVVNVFEDAKSKSPVPSSPVSVSITVAPADVTFWFKSTPPSAFNVSVDPAVKTAFWTIVPPDVILTAASVVNAPPRVTDVVASEIVKLPNVNAS